jgi:hypothetical protein
VTAAAQRLLDHPDTSKHCLAKIARVMKHGELYGHITEAMASWLGTVHVDVIRQGKCKHNDWWYGEYDSRPIKQRRKEFYKKERERREKERLEWVAEQDRLEEKLLKLLSSPR